jgi:hypothetical protein
VKPHGLAVSVFLPLVMACSRQPFPTQPSGLAAPAFAKIRLEAEAGRGDGQIKERSRASGGRTVHLGPQERRLWTVDVGAGEAPYALSVTYSNGQEGANEVIRVIVDGRQVSSFQNRDSGDATEGWNIFVTDTAGTSMLDRGIHTVTLEVNGGDGCVEIDFVTLSPAR